MLDVRDPADVRSVSGGAGDDLVVREKGKALAEARGEVTKTAAFLGYYASFARQPWGELLADARPGSQTGAPGLRFYTRIKTTAVRYSW